MSLMTWMLKVIMPLFQLMTKHRNENLIQAFGDHVRQIRHSKNLSMASLAAICDLEEKQIARIEYGEVNTSLSMIAIIAYAFDMTIPELMTFQYER